ncbi:MAG: 3-phosphoshikimate 1-carboxyvinyltransferase [Acidobacteriota bacterium]|nr:MAG: 3-phosphoshikimate 1-carboxyvinyltransferase [Acidobacteriota bacterium]
MKIACAKKVSGEIGLPGDKSISHRAAIIGSIADGVTRISDFSEGADCASTLACLSALGIGIEREGQTVRVFGRGKHGLSAPSEALDCGNSGTTARLLAGVLAGQPFRSTLSGDSSLRSRPMNRVIEPLLKMGAAVESSAGTLPLTVEGKHPLDPIAYQLPVASAQVKSCVLLAGLFADGITSVTEPKSGSPGPVSRDHTELMLLYFGAEIEEIDFPVEREFEHSVKIDGASRLEGRHVSVPGDISSAAFLIAAAAGLEGSSIKLRNVGLNPTRLGVIEALRRTGASIEIEQTAAEGGEPSGTIAVRGGLDSPKNALVFGGRSIANLIDELPVLAVLGTRLEGGIEVRDAVELRKKESDRISAVVTNLRKMGAEVEEFDDGFRVGRSELKGALLDSFGDHRIAMAFAVAGLFAEGDSRIEGAECVDVSFPGFFGVLGSIVS